MSTNWDVLTLETAGRWLSGGTPSKQLESMWHGPVPWVSPKDMKRRRLADAIDHVAVAAIGNGTQLAPFGSLLMVVRGMILAHSFPVALTTAPVAFNQDIKALVPAAGWSSEFLLQWLQFKASDILRLVDVANHGTKRLPSERLFGLSIERPPEPEQRKIAAILASVDEAIEATQAVIEQLQVVKKAMMAELLTRGLPGRHTRFKQTEIGEVPETWKVVSLQELCSAVVDCSHTTPKYVAEGIPVIRTADVVPGRLLIRHAKRVSEETWNERVKRLVPIPGDVFYSREGERFGIAAPVPPDVRTCVGQRMMHLRANSTTDATFLCWLMNAPIVYSQAVADVGGSTSPHVNVGAIRSFRVPYPPRDEQAAIGRILDLLELRIESEESTRTGYSALKSALMSVLLTGEVRVKPDPEPT